MSTNSKAEYTLHKHRQQYQHNIFNIKLNMICGEIAIFKYLCFETRGSSDSPRSSDLHTLHQSDPAMSPYWSPMQRLLFSGGGEG